MGCLIPGCDSLDVAIFEMPSDEAGLLIYPNPVSAEAIVQITFNNPQELNQLEIKLFDMSGRCVSSQPVDDVEIDGDKIRFGFQRGNLVSGIYLVEINSGGELVGGGKVVLR
ncbi:MAG: T9SS type A sorting domain-containing protein [Bacteroidetes bacterium]|nr:T9SS type A sorting domain-containing protein [Bacteroidota bacterium]